MGSIACILQIMKEGAITMNVKSLDRNLKIIYFSMFGSMACFFPFISVYFQEKGLSLTQIGIMFALWSVTGVVAQPIWGFITDKYSYKKATIMITMALSAFGIYALVFANSFFTVAVAVVLFFSVQTPINTVTDAYTYEIISKNEGLQFGKIRFIGSFGYAVTSFSMGLIIKALGISTAFMGYSIAAVIALLFISRIRYKGQPSGIRLNINEVGIQLCDKRFLYYILLITFFSIAFGGNSAYMTILIKERGGDFFQLGLVGFIIAMSEFPSLHFGTRLLKRFGDINILCVSMFFYVIRYFLNSVGTTSEVILIIQAMQSLTYPLFLISTYDFIARSTQPKMRTTALTINAAAIGIGSLIGNLGGGFLLEFTTLSGLYKVLSVICLASCLAVLGLKKLDAIQEGENIEIKLSEMAE